MPDVSAGYVVLHKAPDHLPFLAGSLSTAVPSSSEDVTSELGEKVSVPRVGEVAQTDRLSSQTSSEDRALSGGLPVFDSACPEDPAVTERQPGARHQPLPSHPALLPPVAGRVVAGHRLAVHHVHLRPRQHQLETCTHEGLS